MNNPTTSISSDSNNETQSYTVAKLSAAVKAYKEFMDAMKELEESERQLVHDTIRQIDDEKMKIIRARIAAL